MKKPTQYVFGVITIFAISVQLIHAQLSPEQTSKAESIINSELNKDYVKNRDTINNDAIDSANSMELFADQKSNKTDGQSVAKLRNKKVNEINLSLVDDEERLQVENWMLNPSDWLCFE
jgi:hypothetical protein